MKKVPNIAMATQAPNVRSEKPSNPNKGPLPEIDTNGFDVGVVSVLVTVGELDVEVELEVKVVVVVIITGGGAIRKVHHK
ncbi:hypothetical protein HMI55_004132 [Coelomomyces lativittatus]|nr:hypothetical protein HMI55_004132 [Coelomomyces lativittatus]